MNLFELSAVFLGLVAAIGWVNAKTLRLPTAVAMMSAGVLGALGLYLLQTAIPPFWGFDVARGVLQRLNFSEAVLGYMLAFLLFAGGMHVDLHELRLRVLPVWTLATLGVLASTLIVGSGLHWAAGRLGLGLPLAWAFVFAALISPTDPVAVLETVRQGGLSRRLAAVLQGEALFNDGVGIVGFTAALAFAAQGAAPRPLELAGSVLLEAGGGVALGWIGGRLAVLAMEHVDDHVVETTLTVALAMGAYSLGQALHLSGPIAAATAGVVVGGYGIPKALSDRSQAYVQAFWSLADEILNASLFLLLGLQMFVVRFDVRWAGLWFAAGALVTAARLLVVLPWGAWFHFRHEERGPSLVLAWGGLRGGISVALALSIPHGTAHDLLVAMTFAVVSMSLLFQGLTFGPLARALHASGEGGADAENAPPGGGLSPAAQRRVLDDAPLSP